jgi:hypothetical protein
MSRSDPWFRMYHATLDNPKVQKLPGEQFKTWVNLLCLACRTGGRLPSDADIAFALRVPETKVKPLLKRFIDAELIDANGDELVMHDWDVLQFKSDVSTGRVKRHRERHRNVSGNVSGNVAATPAETDQIQNRAEQTHADACVPRKQRKARRTRLADDWKPSEADRAYARTVGLTDAEIDAAGIEFSRYWRSADAARGGLKADWYATWCGNIDRTVAAIIARRPRAGKPGQHRPDVGGTVDLVARLKAEADLGRPVHGARMGRGGDGLRAAGDDADAAAAGDGPGGIVIDADDAERMFRASRGAEVVDEGETGAVAGPRSPIAALRSEADGIPGGCGSQGPDDTAEHDGLVAGVGRAEGEAGPALAAAAETGGGALDYEPDVGPMPDFLKRT